ncbi:MAG: zinc-ribbon domain-containing protein [Oscillospiraceae bacterium]
MLCNHCGKEINENVSFCPECGEQLSETQVKENVTIKRTFSLASMAVGFDILIDGINVGKIQNNQTVSIPLTGGKHTIQFVCQKKWHSKQMEFSVSSNAVPSIECHIFAYGLLPIVAAIMPNDFITVNII